MDTLYSFRDAYPPVYQRGRGVTASRPVYRDGALVAPTQAGSTYTLLGPGGDIIVNAQPVTVTNSIATYALTSTHLASTLVLGEGYQEVWALVLDGATITTDREVAVGLRQLYPVVTDEDLTADYPVANRDLPGEATSWQGFLDEAWKEIVSRLVMGGHLSYSIKSAFAFRRPHKELTHALRFRALAAARPSQTNFMELQKHHQDRYEAAWKDMNWTSDENGDGRPDNPQRRRGTGGGILHINGSPGRRPPKTAKW